MILVICEPEDTCGLWLVTEISKRGCAVEHVLPDELVVGARFSVRVANQHDIVSADLADGRRIDGSTLVGVINRMHDFPSPMYNGTSDRDTVYASEEVRAAVVAWFAGLPCPVLNTPTPYSAIGLMVHESLWRQRANMLGLRVATLKVEQEAFTSQPKNYSVVVVGETVLTAEEKPVPLSMSEASIALSHSMGLRLVELEFNIKTSGEWEFLRACLTPDLTSLGPTVLDALLRELEER
ncbi:MAG: hypothetical protein ACI8ZB_004014 [Desulforhopalus sp.]|jgi:hypothetical protein